MKVGGETFKTVFFLGAGASRGATPHVLLNQKRIKAPLNGDFFKIAKTYANALGRKSQRVLQGSYKKAITNNKFEKFLSYLEKL